MVSGQTGDPVFTFSLLAVLLFMLTHLNLYLMFRFEHIELHDELDGKEYVVEFDFLGKDSIRYVN